MAPLSEPRIQNIPPPKTEVGQRIVRAIRESFGMPLGFNYAEIEKRILEKEGVPAKDGQDGEHP